MIGLTIMISGCAKEKVSNDSGKVNNSEDKSDEESEKETPDIRTCLEEDNKISEIIWSKDNSKVAYIKEIRDLKKELYIWDSSEEKGRKVEGVTGNLCYITWSPDYTHLTVNKEISNIYETIIINPFNLMILSKTVNTGWHIWSQDSLKLAFTVTNDLGGTSDLAVYYIDTMTQYTVLRGGSNFFYELIDWNEYGLKYRKYYTDNIEANELKYDEYNIGTLIYTAKNENTEVIINYPMVENLSDEETESLVNSHIRDKAGVLNDLTEYEDETYKATLNVDYEITKKSKGILSMYFVSSLLMDGAAFPIRFIEGVTFDMNIGTNLELKDLFKEGVDYKSTLDSILNEKVNELDYELFEEFKGIEEEQGFYLTDSSLVIYYQEYIYGRLFLEIPLEEIEDILK